MAWILYTLRRNEGNTLKVFRLHYTLLYKAAFKYYIEDMFFFTLVLLVMLTL